MDSWDSDTVFGFDGSSAGGNFGTATAPTPSAPANSTVRPQPTAAKALIDPRGSAIFWVAAAAVLGLAMVSGQLSVNAKVRARGGK